MKKSLFGKNIPVNCSYCEYNGIENDIMFCKKSKQVKDGKCRSFKYDPLLRMPNVTVFTLASSELEELDSVCPVIN